MRDGDDAVDGDPIERGIGAEAARRADQIAQALARLQLVDRGAHDGSRHPYSRAVHWNEDQVARLEPDVGPRVTPQQIVVQVEHGHALATAADLDRAHVGAVGHPARERSGRADGGVS